MFRFTNDYSNKSLQYKKAGISGTLILAYQEFDKLFNQHLKEGKRALDFGCGAGRSTRYLKETGLSVHGVDIDPSMLNQARIEDQDDIYYLIENNKIPQRDAYYDLVFSSLVLLEIPTLNQMQSVLEEIYRVMKLNASLIVLTVNDDFYNHDWVSVNTHYNGNQNLKSGDIAKVKIKEIDLELNDYYWTRQDYKKAAEAAGFTIVEELLPKADQYDSDNAWISEKEFAPYVIFTMKKTLALVNVKEKANFLDLQLLPDIGYFKEIERSSDNQYSACLLLMQHGDKCVFHKIKSEETLTHLEGKDIILHLIDKNGKYEKKYIGKENDHAILSFKITSGTWFAEEMDGEYGYSLIKAETTPAFQKQNVEEADYNELIKIAGDNQEAILAIDRLTNVPSNLDRRFRV